MDLSTVAALAVATRLWGGAMNVRFGSKADIPTSQRHVRFTPNNGRWAAHPSQHLAVGL